MLDFVIGYLKWVMHVVVKLFFILIVGLFLLAVVGLPFGIQANSMFEGASISYMAKKTCTAYTAYWNDSRSAFTGF